MQEELSGEQGFLFSPYCPYWHPYPPNIARYLIRPWATGFQVTPEFLAPLDAGDPQRRRHR